MSTTCWQRNDSIAQLASERLWAQLDLNSPHQGLRQLKCEQRSLSGTLLGLHPVGEPMGQLGALEDCYIRGTDLVAVYAQDQGRPQRTQVYWRPRKLGTNENPTENWIGVEMVVSVQTDLLDSLPELESRTSLLADEVLHLEDPSGRSVRRLQGDMTLQPDQGPCCIIVRLSDLPLSYVEMQPALDFRETQISISGHEDSQQKIVLSQRLFPQRLEKGVILRARLCGVFVPRADDLRRAATLYERLNLEELPLTT